jgi:hypothetical protein
MEIDQYFEKSNPDDCMSEITFRAVNISTPLAPIHVRNLITEYIGSDHLHMQIIGVIDRKTILRVSVGKADPAFARFLYEIMNWETNSSRQNQ